MMTGALPPSASDEHNSRPKRQKLQAYDLKPLIDFLYFETRNEGAETTPADLQALLPENPEDWNVPYTEEGIHHNKTALWLLTEAVCNEVKGALEALDALVNSDIALNWHIPITNGAYCQPSKTTPLFYLFEAAMHRVGHTPVILDTVLTKGFTTTQDFETHINNLFNFYKHLGNCGYRDAFGMAARFLVGLNRAMRVYHECVTTADFQPLVTLLEQVEKYASDLMEKDRSLTKGCLIRMKKGYKINGYINANDLVNPWVPFALLKFYESTQSVENAKRWYDQIKPNSEFYEAAQFRFVHLLLATQVREAKIYNSDDTPGSASRAEKKENNRQRRTDLLNVLKVALAISPNDTSSSELKRTVGGLYLSKQNSTLPQLNSPQLQSFSQLQGPVDSLQMVLDVMRENIKLKKVK